jgi:hypothetical protein
VPEKSANCVHGAPTVPGAFDAVDVCAVVAIYILFDKNTVDVVVYALAADQTVGGFAPNVTSVFNCA